MRSASVDSSLAKHEDGGRGSKAVPLNGKDIVVLRYGCWKCLGIGAALACSASIAGRMRVVDFILEIIVGGRRGRSRVTKHQAGQKVDIRMRQQVIFNSTFLHLTLSACHERGEGIVERLTENPPSTECSKQQSPMLRANSRQMEQ